jgi:parallel beta-helix repeat protein
MRPLQLKIALAILLSSLAMIMIVAIPAHSEASAQTIFIRADGSIDPPNAPLTLDGNIYTFTSNAYSPLVVQKPGITIDGAGYTLQGRYNGTKEDTWMIGDGPTSNGTKVLWTIGIDMAKDTIGNLTIKNLKIQNFSIGMYLWTKGNIITGNTVKDTIVGILLAGNENTITQNRIMNNDYGVFFGSNNPGNVPSNLDISQNCFANNTYQLSGCVCKTPNATENPHTWDNGKIGNYWADYNGADSNKDGIGDIPYRIDTLNIDRYPLMHDPTNQPSTNTQTTIIIAASVVAVSTIIAAISITRKKAKNQKDIQNLSTNQPKS